MPLPLLRTRLTAFAVVLTAAAMPAQSEVADAATLENLARPIARYCLDCHAGPEAEAGLDLRSIRRREALATEPAVWRRVLAAIKNGSMPPSEARRRPDEAERRRLGGFLASALETATRNRGEWTGRPVMRRLTPRELRLTTADVFGVDLDLENRLPVEAGGSGFDRLGDAQFASALQLEAWLDAVRELIQKLTEDPNGLDRVLGRRDLESLKELLARAFRRPAAPEDLEPRMGLIGDPGALLTSILLSPHYLFRVEGARTAAEGDLALDGSELASRLSYFLTSRPPDADLSARAASGDLVDVVVLEQEARRLLASPQAAALTRDFFETWLGLADFDRQAADFRRFPAFNGLRASMHREVWESIDSIRREDRSLLRLLDAPTLFVDPALARHYGLPAVEGPGLREIAAPDRRRGGLLGMAAVLTATSRPTRTSPTSRGKWILETLLGQELAPPPPTAGSLPEEDERPDGKSLRERLESHRRDPACASCHARIDPLGLALESFDGIGAWRDGDNGRPIDTRTRLPDGRELGGVEDLKDRLLERRREFLRHLAGRMLVYAVGRPLENADDGTLEVLVERALQEDCRLSALVVGVVTSRPFRYLGEQP